MLLGMMALVYLVVALTGGGPRASATITRFPAAYGVINQFVFGLGSLLGIAWTASMAGADWSWGTIRVVLARGEGRIRYALAKAAALGICLVIAVVIAYAVGMALAALTGLALGETTGRPFSELGREDLLSSLGYGTLVLLERAAIGFAVATVLRSQLAGVVAGIGLSIGEGILSTVLFALAMSGDGLARTQTQWYQLLPFRIGESLLAAVRGPSSDLSAMFGKPVEPGLALLITAGYLAVEIGRAHV